MCVCMCVCVYKNYLNYLFLLHLMENTSFKMQYVIMISFRNDEFLV